MTHVRATIWKTGGTAGGCGGRGERTGGGQADSYIYMFVVGTTRVVDRTIRNEIIIGMR